MTTGKAASGATRTHDDDDVPTFAIAGVRVGHATRSGSGVTVVLLPTGSVGSCEVRGGAPATCELDLLDPARTVAHVDAIVLSGGSAFGLAAGDGVMRYLAERGRGYATAAGPVPIVPAACIFDLLEAGDPPPGADDGYAAAVAADGDGALENGRVGGERGRRSASGVVVTRRYPAASVPRTRPSTVSRSARSPWSTRWATSSPRTARSSPDRPRPIRARVPDAAAVRGGARAHDARRRRDRRRVDEARLPLAGAECPRRFRTALHPAHAFRRRRCVRDRDGERRSAMVRRASIGCESPPPTWSRRPFAVRSWAARVRASRPWGVP